MAFDPVPSPLTSFLTCANCFSSRLTSSTELPLPFAMRLRRLPLMTDGSLPLLRRHRVDDGDRPPQVLLAPVHVDALERAHPRDHREHLVEGAHLAELLHLVAVVLERELRAPQLAGEVLRLLPLDRHLGHGDQPEHVAHAQDARDHPRGVERLERVHLLARPGELDRPAGDRGRGERRPAPGVAVELREHDPGDADPAVELLGAAHRVLAGERVRHVEHLGRAPRSRAARRAPPSARRRRGGGPRCPRARCRGPPPGPRRAPSAGSPAEARGRGGAP